MRDDPVSGRLTVYHDGGCPLCRAEIGLYRRCAGAERIAEAAYRLSLPLRPRLARLIARQAGRSVAARTVHYVGFRDD